VTFEESVSRGGFGSGVLELLEEARLADAAYRDVAVRVIGHPRRSLRGPRVGADLRRMLRLDAAGLPSRCARRWRARALARTVDLGRRLSRRMTAVDQRRDLADAPPGGAVRASCCWCSSLGVLLYPFMDESPSGERRLSLFSLVVLVLAVRTVRSHAGADVGVGRARRADRRC
jgi:hypothetical protein